MGSVSLKIGDGTARFRRATACSSALHLLMLASVLTTNLFALYAFTSSPNPPPSNHANLSIISHHISSILREIDSSQHQLHQLQSDLFGHDPINPSLAPELNLFLSPHPLPLGPDSRSKITSMASSIAHTCAKSPDLLAQFMSYKPYSPCPTADSHLPHKLISLGCDPLPRRRCLTRSKPRRPLPSPPLVDRKNNSLIDKVLAMGGGGIRIGFDIAGGAADNFAAKMAEKNVTIITSSVDDEGIFSLQLSPASRFPFYDAVFDLVRVGHGLDEGGLGGVEAMEFLMFDVDRVLRAGGLLWLDDYVCVDDERKRVVVGVIERFGYRKLRWVVGEKAEKKKKVYLSAVLRKPARG